MSWSKKQEAEYQDLKKFVETHHGQCGDLSCIYQRSLIEMEKIRSEDREERLREFYATLDSVQKIRKGDEVPTYSGWLGRQSAELYVKLFGPVGEALYRHLQRKEKETGPNFDTRHLPFIPEVLGKDRAKLTEGESNYGGSWKRRGGTGAFMMLARKWDRIERAAAKEAWELLDAILKDDRPEGLIDDIRDLRQYLALVEAEAKARGLKSEQKIQ